MTVPRGRTSLRRQGEYTMLRSRGRKEMAAAAPLPASTPWWWRFDPVLLVLIILFVAFEVVAHFHYHNANGWQTLSNRIVTFERKYGWPARIVVYGALIVLGIHLWGGIF